MKTFDCVCQFVCITFINAILYLRVRFTVPLQRPFNDAFKTKTVEVANRKQALLHPPPPSPLNPQDSKDPPPKP